jgi:cytochrome b561
MKIKNTSKQYGLVSMLFHWLMGIVIIGLLVLGWIMDDLDGPNAYWWWSMHKTFGFFILLLIPIRFYWRLINESPDNVDSSLLKRISSWNIWTLYALMFAMALSGFIMSDAGGHAIKLFHLYPLPFVFTKNPELSKLGWLIHSYAAYAISFLVSLHILAALYHHYFRKDRVLKSILPS